MRSALQDRTVSGGPASSADDLGARSRPAASPPRMRQRGPPRVGLLLAASLTLNCAALITGPPPVQWSRGSVTAAVGGVRRGERDDAPTRRGSVGAAHFRLGHFPTRRVVPAPPTAAIGIRTLRATNAFAPRCALSFPFTSFVSAYASTIARRASASLSTKTRGCLWNSPLVACRLRSDSRPRSTTSLVFTIDFAARRHPILSAQALLGAIRASN